MEIDSFSSFLDDNTFQQQYHQQTESMEITTFDQQLAAALCEDFPCPLSAESDTISPQLDIDHIISTPQIYNNNNNNNVSNNNIDDNNNSNNNNNKKNIASSDTDEESRLSKNKEAVSGGRKRKRQPSQVQDHIIAERKRRELLGQMFISLSTIIPGLKKTDKTSILGEAIKHMKQLQEKVKVLEEVATKRIVESIVVVKKSHLTTVENDDGDNNDTSSTVDNNCVSGSSGGNLNDGGGNGAHNFNNSLPEIELKITGTTLLLRIYCEVQKGILANLFTELAKHDMSVTNCSVIPFYSLALDITIVAQMERGFTNNVKDFVKSVRAACSPIDHPPMPSI